MGVGTVAFQIYTGEAVWWDGARWRYTDGTFCPKAWVEGGE